MTCCAYCGVDCIPTHEHIIPDWYSKAVGQQGLETFNARNPIGHLYGDILINDVCKRCNNEALSGLDEYGKLLYGKVLSIPVYCSESTVLDYDYNLLLRWLLKLCFNSARVHNADVSILSEYRDYIFGEADIPAKPVLFAHLVAPTDYSVSPPVPARRNVGGDNNIEEPCWFRLTQFRSDSRYYTDMVQRQIYIDTFCFTFFIPAPDREEHCVDIMKLKSQFQAMIPSAKELTTDGHMELAAGNVHLFQCMYSHMANYPIRYTGNHQSDDREFGSIITDLVSKRTGLLMISIPKEEIEVQATARVVARLKELVNTRESAIAAMQRVAILVDGYNDDVRECWEIPEVRRFLCDVFVECPYIAFLALPNSGMLTTFACCLCDPIRLTPNTVRFDTGKLRIFVNDAFCGLNVITQHHAISVEINKAISDDILNAFAPVGGLSKQLGTYSVSTP